MLEARIALSRWKLLSHTEMISCMRQDWCPCLAVKICIKGISKVLTICQELMIKGLLLRFIYTLNLCTQIKWKTSIFYTPRRTKLEFCEKLNYLSLSFHCISDHLSDERWSSNYSQNSCFLSCLGCRVWHWQDQLAEDDTICTRHHVGSLSASGPVQYPARDLMCQEACHNTGHLTPLGDCHRTLWWLYLWFTCQGCGCCCILWCGVTLLLSRYSALHSSVPSWPGATLPARPLLARRAAQVGRQLARHNERPVPSMPQPPPHSLTLHGKRAHTVQISQS